MSGVYERRKQRQNFKFYGQKKDWALPDFFVIQHFFLIFTHLPLPLKIWLNELNFSVERFPSKKKNGNSRKQVLLFFYVNGTNTQYSFISNIFHIAP